MIYCMGRFLHQYEQQQLGCFWRSASINKYWEAYLEKNKLKGHILGKISGFEAFKVMGQVLYCVAVRESGMWKLTESVTYDKRNKALRYCS